MTIDRYAGAQLALIGVGVLLTAWNTTAGLIISLAWLLPIVIAINIGYSRGRTGWMWGAFLGWLGVLILACMRPSATEASA